RESPTSSPWRRRIRAQIEWKVPIHGPLRRSSSRSIPSRPAIRSRISPAALLVKVTARIRQAGTPSSISAATRWVITRVLPVPAPASSNSGPPRCSTPARWAGLRGRPLMPGRLYAVLAVLAGRGRARVHAERRQRTAWQGARREFIGHERPTSNTAMLFGGGVMHARELFPDLLRCAARDVGRWPTTGSRGPQAEGRAARSAAASDRAGGAGDLGGADDLGVDRADPGAVDLVGRGRGAGAGRASSDARATAGVDSSRSRGAGDDGPQQPGSGRARRGHGAGRGLVCDRGGARRRTDPARAAEGRDQPLAGLPRAVPAADRDPREPG